MATELSSSAEERPLRKDAERNRRRILDAAAGVFAERGLDVSLDDIAAAAQVGIGTVYRRFSDREALIDALFEDKIRSIEQLARESWAIEDPWEAFAHFLGGSARMQAADRGLKEVLLCSARGRERVGEARDTIRPIAEQIVARARDAGVLRADFEQYDIPFLHFAIGYVAERTRDVAPEYFERTLTIMLDGLRARRDGVTPMSQPPISHDGFIAAMGRRRC